MGLNGFFISQSDAKNASADGLCYYITRLCFMQVFFDDLMHFAAYF